MMLYKVTLITEVKADLEQMGSAHSRREGAGMISSRKCDEKDRNPGSPGRHPLYWSSHAASRKTAEQTRVGCVYFMCCV